MLVIVHDQIIQLERTRKIIVLHHYGNALVLDSHACKKILLEAKCHHMNTSYIHTKVEEKSNEAGVNEIHLVFDKPAINF